MVRPFAKLVRPPVQVYGIEGRYATALYSAASKEKKLDQVEKELLRVGQLLKDPKVSLAVLNPYIKRTVKVKSLNDITKREKFSPLTANLMNLLAENGRLGNTQGIISAFSTIMSVHRGEVPCTVTTASPLDDAVLSELKTVLKSFLSPNQTAGPGERHHHKTQRWEASSAQPSGFPKEGPSPDPRNEHAQNT